MSAFMAFWQSRNALALGRTGPSTFNGTAAIAEELYNNCAARNQRYKMVNGTELYDLDTDPEQAHNIDGGQPARLAKMRSAYEAWFKDVATTRNFETPTIYLGTRFENPVLLTRQDWRGPLASWEPGGLGHWEVAVKESGDYELTLMFPAVRESGQGWATLGGCAISSRLPQIQSR